MPHGLACGLHPGAGDPGCSAGDCVIFFPCSLLFQLMQQQAAIMASVAQGGYLNPMAAFAAAQMQQMAALNMNGLAAAPMTPTSGKGPGRVEGAKGIKSRRGRRPQRTCYYQLVPL